jgi:hypothetical protein
MTQALHVLDIDALRVTVPASMLADYWDAMAELEAERQRWAERSRKARIQRGD